ncbi:hypothetical protein D3C75_731680 [compost metagenome]
MLQAEHFFRFQINAGADRGLGNPVRSHGDVSDQLALHTVIRHNPELRDHLFRLGDIMQNNPRLHQVGIQERTLLAEKLADFQHPHHMIGKSGKISVMMGFGRRIMH